MGRIRLDRMLVVDLEMTCWEGDPPPGESPEVIEIGVAELLLGPQPSIGRSRSFLVRPTRSRVSPFCAALTGITPERIRRDGRPLREAVASVRKEFGGAGKAWAAWGRDDRMLAADCALAGCDAPFSDEFANLGMLYAALSGAARPVGLADALAQEGLGMEGRHHSGVDDAVNTARLVIALSGRLFPRADAEPGRPLSASPSPRG